MCKGEFELFEWLRRRKQPYNENMILNDGLDYAMEFGSNWLQPIQSRLVKLYPELTENELDSFNSKCQTAMKTGHNQVYALAEEFGKDASIEVFSVNYSKSFPWVNKKNLKHVFSQGMYYAWKDIGW
jgi:hypothetical protein